MSGKYQIQIKKAILTRDTNYLLDMCPNYEVFYKDKLVIEGKPSYMGTKPFWKDFAKVDHHVKLAEGKVRIKIKNEGVTVGKIDIDAKELIKMKGKDIDYDIFHKPFLG